MCCAQPACAVSVASMVVKPASRMAAALVGDDAGGGDGLDRFLPQIHQRDVGTVVGRIVVGIEAGPLGAEWMVVRAQCRGSFGVLHHGADLFVNQLAD